MPNTVNIALNTPNTGDNVGSWGTTVLNSNWQVVDGIFAGVLNVALTSVSFALSISSGVIGTGSLTPGAGPVQAHNAILKLGGTLTGNPVITFPRPGFWIVENLCVVGSNYVQLRASGTGLVIAAPPGEAIHVYCDGTNMAFVDMGRTGSLMSLVVSTTQAWMTACSIQPWLVCNGATYSTASYTALGTMLGSTFGGNGITTFGVPDFRNRVPLMLGTLITTAAGGMNGNQIGATGGTSSITIGTSNLPASIPYTDPGHIHGLRSENLNEGAEATKSVGDNSSGSDFFTASSTTNITINPGSPNTPFNILQPSMVMGCVFIKT